MANAFSVQADFGDYIQPINTDLVNFVLSSKQQKYDYNVAKIDETIAEFGIDLERQSDKDYVIQKLNGVLDSVNNLGKMDLSNGNITRSIQQQIRGTLDEKMINAAVSTRNYRNFQGTLQQAKKDGTYSDINAGYAMDRGGVAAWLNDATDTLGSVSYTPYQDVNAKVTKNIKDLKQFNPERTIDIPFQDASGVNRIISKKVKDLNEAELRSYVMSNLDENSQKQLQINGWAKFNGASDEDLSNYAQSYKNGRIKQYDTDIALVRKQMESAPSYMVQDLRDRLNVLQSEKNSFTATMNSIGSDRDNIGRVIMQEQLVDDVSRAYADTSVSYELKTDTAYYEKAKLDFQKVKLLTQNQKKASTASGQTSQGVTASPQVRATSTPFEHPDKIDPTQTTQDFVAEQEQKTNQIAKGLITQLDPESKKIFDSLKKADPSKSDAELLDSMNLNLTYEDEQGNQRFFRQTMNDMKDVYEDSTEAHKESMTSLFEENLDDVYSEITSEGFANFNEFPLVQADGSLVRMDTFLAENNISLEDFKNNVNGIQDTVKKSLYLNKAFSQATNSVTADSAGRRNAGIVDKEYLLGSDNFEKINNYIKIADPDDDILNHIDFINANTGEKLTPEDIASIGEGVLLSSREPYRLKPKSREARQMLNFFDQRQGIMTDARVDDEGRLSEIISFDSEEFNNKLSRNLRERSAKDLIIDPNLGKGGKEVSDIHQRFQRYVNPRGIEEPVKNKPFIISRTNNPNELLITQNDEDVSPIIVPKREVEEILGERLPDSTGSQIVSNREVINRDIAPVNLTKAEGMKSAEVLQGMIARREILPSVIGKAEFRENIANSSVQGFRYSNGEITPAGNLANFVIDNDFKNLSVAYRPRNKGGIVTVMRKDTQEEIESYPVPPNFVTVTRNTVRYNPQLYIQNLLTNMVTSFGKQQEQSELYQKLAQSQAPDGGQ